MKKFVSLLLATSLLSLTLGCTENIRAKAFGGESNITLKCNQKLFDVTWKAANLWYATRPMRAGEEAEAYSFAESSSWGMLEGTVTFTELICK